MTAIRHAQHFDLALARNEVLNEPTPPPILEDPP
jgi:hypothetical protein